MSAKLFIYHASDVVLDPFEPLLREEGICLKKITPSGIEDLKRCEGLKILFINNRFVNDMDKEMSDLIFCSDSSSVVICINGDQKQKIIKSCDEEKIFLYLKEPVEECEFMKAIKSGFGYLHSKQESERLHSALDSRTMELSSLNEIDSA